MTAHSLRQLECCHEQVVGARLDKDARAGTTVLAGVVEEPPWVLRHHGLRDPRVGKDDVGALAPELKHEKSLHLLRRTPP